MRSHYTCKYGNYVLKQKCMHMQGMMHLVKNFHVSKEIVSKYFILLSHPHPASRNLEQLL